MINQNENYRLYSPGNSWETNYTLMDDSANIAYLIDCGDVQNNADEIEEYGGMVWDDFKSLDFIGDMIELSWKHYSLT
jgi:hypothetical protein